MSNFRESGICCYCGVQKATTRDHVPPKGIFNLPLPSNLMTVPCCHSCNNSTSKNDELFRSYLGMHVAKKQGIGEKFFTERTIPSIKHNNGLQRHILQNLSPIFLASNSKPFEKAYSMKWDSNVHDSTIEKIARGLYYYEYKEILGSEVQIQAYWFHSFPQYDIQKLLHRSMQEGAFSYYYNRAEDSPKHSMWLFQFYDTHWAGAMTHHKS